MTSTSDRPAWVDAVLRESREAWSFSTLSFIFNRNYDELRHHLEQSEVDPVTIDLLMHYDEAVVVERSRQIARLLHNMVTAGVALRTAMLKAHSRLHADGTFPQFHTELDKRIDSRPHIQIMFKLRDHLVHMGPIPIGFRPHAFPSGERHVEATLDLESLRRYAQEEPKYWTGKRGRAAKQYLEDAQDPTLLKILAIEFELGLRDFCGWYCDSENDLRQGRLVRAGHPLAASDPEAAGLKTRRRQKD